MIFYVVLPLFFIIFYLFMRRIKNGKKLFLLISLILLLCVSSFRSETMGADYKTYIYVFDNIRSIVNSYPMEKGFLGFIYLVSYISDKYYVISFFINLVIFGCFYFYIIKFVDEDYYFWIIFIFVLNPYLYIQSTFNVIRQTMSIAIVLISIKFLLSKNYILFILFAIIAGLFHTLGLIFIILIVIKLIHWNKKKLIIVPVFALIMNILINLFGITNIFTSFFGYERYADFTDTMFNFSVFIVFTFIISCILIYFSDRFNYQNDNEKFFMNTYIISISLLPIFVTNDVMYRVYIGFVFISLPAIPIIIRSITGKQQSLIIRGIYLSYYVLLYVLFVYSIIESNNTSYIPFEFFW